MIFKRRQSTRYCVLWMLIYTFHLSVRQWQGPVPCQWKALRLQIRGTRINKTHTTVSLLNVRQDYHRRIAGDDKRNHSSRVELWGFDVPCMFDRPPDCGPCSPLVPLQMDPVMPRSIHSWSLLPPTTAEFVEHCLDQPRSSSALLFVPHAHALWRFCTPKWGP